MIESSTVHVEIYCNQKVHSINADLLPFLFFLVGTPRRRITHPVRDLLLSKILNFAFKMHNYCCVFLQKVRDKPTKTPWRKFIG